MIRALIVALLMVALAAPLAACGKKDELEAPEDEKIRYPRQYPR